jgi:hypothetical protein
MQLCNQGKQKPKWKDPRTSNVKTQTQTQVYIGEAKVKEGIELGWSQRFVLDELDV